ncbi:hypothetical protein [Fodinicola acaciae]|uniref:hypothetical protein n=1 Tax=Fodinicola acaciae TaxID=2681555 RepID=UPI0013D73E93|nr:hypothetical protein [Fodinicola acaciae]
MSESPLTARQLRSEEAAVLADLAAIYDDLRFVLGCCERLLADRQDPVVAESLWVAALSTYARCFRDRKSALSARDVADTPLKGEVAQWHELLGKLRDFVVDDVANLREEYFVGVSETPAGKPAGIVVTSIPRPTVDETTVRQTGRLAYELSVVVDNRIKEQTEKVFDGARQLTAKEFAKLSPIDVDWSPTMSCQ